MSKSTERGFENITLLTRKNFNPDATFNSETEALRHGLTTVMCFAGWCGHCTAAKPIYNEICKMGKCMNINLCGIDAVANKDLIERLNKVIKLPKGDTLIAGYPTFIQFKDGKYLRRYDESYNNREALLAFIIGD